MTQDVFVGRQEEQKQFEKFLSGEVPWMLVVTGLGGIGKSTLLRHFVAKIPTDTCHVMLNFADEITLRTDPLKLLEVLAIAMKPYCDPKQFNIFTEMLQNDRNQFKQYGTQMQQRIEESKTIYSEETVHTVTLDKTDEASVFAQKVQQTIQEVQRQERELAAEAFYAQIDTFRLNRLVIMFDTCELLNEPESWEFNQWLMNELLPRLHAHMWQVGQNCFIVMAGRVPPQSDVIDELDQQQIVLSMLSKAAVEQYLELTGMHDGILRQQVYNITHGHALCVSIIGNFHQDQEQKHDLFSEMDGSLLQEEFDERASIEFINERILNNLKSPLKELTQYGVLLRSFNLPLLKAIFPDLLPERDAFSLFEKFIRYPYIEAQGNYRYAFHELVREVLAKRIQKDHPKEWKHYHKRALDYFTQGSDSSSASVRSPEWYYHALAYSIACGQEVEGMTYWREAVQEAHIGRTRKEAVTLLQIAYDQTLSLSPAACAVRDYEQGRSYYYVQQWELALKSYTQAFKHFEQIRDYLGQANVAKAMGDVQHAQAKLDTALQSYKEAHSLYGVVEDRLGQAKALQAIGIIKQSRDELDEALDNYEQAFQLFGQMMDRLGQADVCKAIGDVQRASNMREVALQSYRQAIALYEDVGSYRGKIETEQVRDEILASFEAEHVKDKVYFAYVVAAHADREFVERLKDDLYSLGINIWTDQGSMQTGTPDWEETLRRAIRSAYTVLLIASPDARISRQVRDELRMAEQYQRPVYSVWVRGSLWMDSIPRGWESIQFIDARMNRYQMALDEIFERASTTLPQPLTLQPRNPYKGLQAFTTKDSRDFFGREALVREMTTVLEQIVAADKERKHSTRLMMLLGASGSGKSSVVMAGLLPYLQQQGISDSQDWIYLPRITPGKHPLEALALSLAQHSSLNNVLSILRDLTSDPLHTLHLLACQLAGSSSRRVVLFIDQFEEVFTLTASEDERMHFFDLLVTAVTEPQGPLLVLLTLRADFYDRPMQYPELYELLEVHRVAVLPMEREDLRRVIEGPAQLPDVQLTFDKDLVGDLLFEVRDQGASLPLLQFTLDQLFEQRNGHRLTRHAYEAIGGVKGALVKHAEVTYANLPSKEHQKLAQNLFVRLIDPGATSQDTTRRRATLSEFLLPDLRQTQLLRETMDAFIFASLLTINEIAGIITVEVSHEALIREWPRFAQWIREVRENLFFQQVLSKSVAQWEQLGRPKELLYRGSQLKKAGNGVKYSMLNSNEQAFLRRSIGYKRQRIISNIVVILTSVLLAGSIVPLLAFIRPSWCPLFLCPAPNRVYNVYDKNLGISLINTQSNAYAISGDPNIYTNNNLPSEAIGAQLLNEKASNSYYVILNIHNLQQKTLLIEQIAIVVNQVSVVPHPLNVWMPGSSTSYTINSYHALYNRQPVSSIILAAPYTPLSADITALVPGESNVLDLRVSSQVAVDLLFRVQITYAISGDLKHYTLTLPNVFEVIFSDISNWHIYQLKNGHFTSSA